MSINRYNQLDLLPYNLDPGATIARNDLIQLLGNKAAREVQTTENDFSFSNVAIVRVVERVEFTLSRRRVDKLFPSACKRAGTARA